MQGGPNIAMDRPEPLGWPEEVKVSAWYVCKDGRWSALASEFNVVGIGASKEEAHENLRDNLHAYLMSYAEDGADFNDAYRPIPRREAVRLLALAVLMRIAKAITPKNRRDKAHFRGPRTVEHSGDVLNPVAC